MFELVLVVAALLVHIDPRRDARLPCAAHEALERRLESLDETQVAPRPHPGALEARLEFLGPWWQLRLIRPDGSTALRRELRFNRDDCPLLAESAALVIDRYLAALPTPPGPQAIAAPSPRPRAADSPPARTSAPPSVTTAAPVPAAPTEPPDAAAGPPAPALQDVSSPPAAPGAIGGTQQIPAGPAARAQAPSAPEANRALSPQATEPPTPPARIEARAPDRTSFEQSALTIAVGPAGLLGLTSDLRGGAWLDIEHPAGGLSLRLFLLGSSRSATSAIFDGSTRGQITAQSLLGGFAVGPCLSGWSRSCASLFFGGRGTIGSSSGPQLFASESVLIVQPELGLLVAMEHELGAGFSLRLTLLAGASPGSAQFQIAGGPSRQLSTFDLAAALLLGYRIF